MKRIILFIAIIISTTASQAQWGPLGSGLNGQVRALTVFQDTIYAGGAFTNPSRIAKWNPGTNTWVAVGTGLDNTVNALVVHNGALYAGGQFTANGDATSMLRIAKLNTTTNKWEAVGAGFQNQVKCFFSDGADLYIGGNFTSSGATPIAKIAKWNGSAFSQVGGDPSATVNAIAKYNNEIYIGCSFTSSYLQKLVGSAWQNVGSVNGDVFALAFYANSLYLGGAFTSPSFRIARVTGSSVGSAINNLNNSVLALLPTSLKLFAGGTFTTSPSSTVSLPHFLSQNGNTPFYAENSSFDGDVVCMANYHGRIVVGGDFYNSGSTALNKVSISSSTINVEEVSSLISKKVFYPNPMTSKAILQIETTQFISNPKLKIYDSNSRLVLSLGAQMENNNNNSIRFDLSREGLAAGNYFYSVEDENGKGLLSDIFIVD